MAKDPTTRDLSDRHEEDLLDLFGGRRTAGSGNQFRDQTDVRMIPGRHTPIAFAFDGKSTQRLSHSVTRQAWDKLVHQAHDLRPAMPLRWYEADNTLKVALDLVVLRLGDFSEILELANTYQEMSDR